MVNYLDFRVRLSAEYWSPHRTYLLARFTSLPRRSVYAGQARLILVLGFRYYAYTSRAAILGGQGLSYSYVLEERE